MSRTAFKHLLWAFVILNGLVGPVVSSIGYDNVHWLLGTPRMLLMLFIGGAAGGVSLADRLEDPRSPT